MRTIISKDVVIKITIGIALVCAAWIILNWSYFYANVKYFFVPQQPVSRQTSAAGGNKSLPNVLVIPSLGIDVPVQYVNTPSEKDFQAALQNGVVHYPNTALPGQHGNVYIFGHSSDFIFLPGSYKHAFALLPRIQKGAQIFLTDSQGREYTYAVTMTFVAQNNDTSVLSQYGNQQYYLTLQTSYPVGTALERYIVRAELEK